MTDRDAISTPRQAPRTEPRVTYVIARLERAMRRQLDEAVRPFGLTTPQYATLAELGARAGQSNAQLARRTFMTPQSMSEVIKALDSKGFISREADSSHGRLIRIELTSAGFTALSACEEAVEVVESQMLRELTPREREQLLADLKSCVRMLGAGFAEM
ncbi:MarR family winged helix-turn-helix transcriptional regulator [Streptomyces sp. NPDC057474]|uniref:MarR family winged helix-turn-helix transcriptional regulator n=1 Tax=Streptomyces sp. NPDC057474 TaxID=3346144 RepID=UPI00368D022A